MKMVLAFFLLAHRFVDSQELQLKVGQSRVLTTREILSLTVSNAHVAKLIRDPFSHAYKLWGISPGTTILTWTTIHSQFKNKITVRVMASVKKEPKKADEHGCQRRGALFLRRQRCSFILPGWD